MIGWLLGTKLGRGLIAALGVALAILGAWTAGKREGGQVAAQRRAEANAKAGKDAKDNKHDLETSDDQRLIDVLTGRVRK